MAVTSNNIRKWCKKNKVPNYLRVNNLEHEVYVWDLLRTYAEEEDGYKTFKMLEKISEGEKVTAGVKAAAQEALKIAMKFENPRKPRAERKPAKNDVAEDAAESRGQSWREQGCSKGMSERNECRSMLNHE
jgi:hypothetical protein